MLGWLTVFAALTLSSLSITLLEKAATMPAIAAAVSFAVLFLLCLLTRAVRSRA